MNQETKKCLSPWIAWAIVLLVAGAAGFAVWYYWDQVDTASNFSVTVTTKTTPTKTKTANENWKEYTNTKYGFDLTLNDAWTGYRWQEIPSTSFHTAFVPFYLPTTDTTINENTTLGGRYADIFTIVVYTPEQWTIVQKATDESTKALKTSNILITETPKYVYAYTINKTLPSDLTGKDFKVTDIIESFKANN